MEQSKRAYTYIHVNLKSFGHKKFTLLQENKRKLITYFYYTYINTKKNALSER